MLLLRRVQHLFRLLLFQEANRPLAADYPLLERLFEVFLDQAESPSQRLLDFGLRLPVELIHVDGVSFVTLKLTRLLVDLLLQRLLLVYFVRHVSPLPEDLNAYIFN